MQNTIVHSVFESLLDKESLNAEQRAVASTADVSNQACDPCDCNHCDPGECRCN